MMQRLGSFESDIFQFFLLFSREKLTWGVLQGQLNIVPARDFASLYISHVLKFDFCLSSRNDMLRSWNNNILKLLCWGVSVNFA